jgi:hypothetical protein
MIIRAVVSLRLPDLVDAFLFLGKCYFLLIWVEVFLSTTAQA